MPKKKRTTARRYRCDVCDLRFKVNAEALQADRAITCPRCRVPFVQPVARKRGRGDALRQLTVYRGLACG